jgi:hypothetical protein
MEPEQIRLECLRLASGYCSGGGGVDHTEMVTAARDFFAFVTGTDAAVTKEFPASPSSGDRRA